MRKILFSCVAFLLFGLSCFAAGETPISNLKLMTTANGNLNSFTNLGTLQSSTGAFSVVNVGGVTHNSMGETTILETWTNEVGNVTSQKVVTAGTTNLSYYGAGTGSGGITNGQTGDIVLGDVKISGSSISSALDPSTGVINLFEGSYLIDSKLGSAFGGRYNTPSIISYGQNGGVGDADLYRGFSYKYGPLVYQVMHDGSIMTSNSITAYGTNTALRFQTVKNGVTSVVVTSDSSVSNTVEKLWKGNAAEVTAITNVEPDTIYFAASDSTVFSDTGIYHPTEIYNVYTDPQTTVVLVVESKNVYKINVNTNSIIVMDASTLNFTNREAKFELDLNITVTNIPSITFVGFEFQQEPDFTVTGCYKFACSMIDTTTVQARQTYPTVYEWKKLIGVSDTGQNEPRNGVIIKVIVASEITNFFQFYVPDREALILDMRAFIYYLDRDTPFHISYARSELSDYSTFQDPITNYVPSANQSGISSGYTGTKMFVPHVDQDFTELGLKIVIMKPAISNGDWMLYTPFSRRANELEIKAYNAGWRP